MASSDLRRPPKRLRTPMLSEYGTCLPKNRNKWTCIFCRKETNGGVSRLKHHLIGDSTSVIRCPTCPEHVRIELRDYAIKKAEERAAQTMRYEPVLNDIDGEDVEGEPKQKANSNKRKKRGPLDRLVPDSEIQDKVMLELDMFKKAAGLFGHNMAIRQREMKAPGISIDTLVETSTDYSIGISIDALGQPLMRGLNMLTKLPRRGLAYYSNLSSVRMDSEKNALMTISTMNITT
ncbi:hypothetical protein F2Q68_00014524 [Brassica cretica]|uniref:BED-type domain-containing protein n=1 Tax=Brassica cretica TaxID=69181 RepID=A0A8S9HIE0_BRACR|nr:hypothetical protein F2Q68_00014524 [Brassica cretica]